MKKKDIFEIPIYRCSFEQFNLEKEERKNQLKTELNSVKKEFPDKFDKYIDSLLYINSYSYKYNEIIGWVNIFIDGNQICGECYFERELKNRNNIKKRFSKCIRKKRFGLIMGKAFPEITITRTSNNFENSKKLIERLERMNRNNDYLKNRFIDLTKLKNIIEFIDWRTLILK